MAILKIARMGHPVLRRAAEPVTDPTAPDIARLVADMIETLADIGGAGLAAPQVHVPLRIVIFRVPEERVSDRPDDRPMELTVLVNPVIEPLGEARELGWEGCPLGAGPARRRCCASPASAIAPRRSRAAAPSSVVAEASTPAWCSTNARPSRRHPLSPAQRLRSRAAGVRRGGRALSDRSRRRGAGDEPAGVIDETGRRDALLAALLPDVPFDGWTRAAMEAAARRIAMDQRELAALFPDGPRAVVAWFSHWADRLTLETVASRSLDGIGGSDRVALAVTTRLKLLAPHREAVRRGLSLLALPGNALLGARLLYDTVDALWFAAGDTATDFSFYTKRAMLAAIYAATNFHWLDDRSPDGAATEAFLARRLAEAKLLPRLKARAARALDLVPDPRRLFRLARPRF